MNIFSLLLRVVLCISLVANGASYAQASVRMQFEHAAHVAEAAPATTTASALASDVPPCHHHRAQAISASASHGSKALAHADPSKPSPAAPLGKKSGADCCKGKTCNCACAYASCVATTSFATPVVPAHDVRVAALAADHPQPRLPHLIRPPIG